jgi:hypothetical protein
MADVENPPVLAVTPDPDDLSGLRIIAVSGVLVYLFCRSAHAPTVVRGLSVAGLVVGILGIAFGALCGFVCLNLCIYGNFIGERQDDVAQVDP